MVSGDGTEALQRCGEYTGGVEGDSRRGEEREGNRQMSPYCKGNPNSLREQLSLKTNQEESKENALRNPD
jgi:hypothetical protein